MANRATAATQSPGRPNPTFASSTTTLTPLSSQARNTFKTSFERFERTVKGYSSTDHRDFSSTTLEDVRQAARQVEQELAARQCLRNMKRLEPFLNGLEAYSKVVEVLCNGTPYVPWIWAPVKLMLKLATDYLGAFEKLIAAYGRIAENLPRFDRLSNAYKNNPDFQQVLAVVYSDILEFHRKAYKFFRKNGWKCFFKSTWGRFDARFNCILESLSRHSDLVDREANAFAIAQTIKWREEAVQNAAMRTKERSAMQYAATLAWLHLDSTVHGGQHEQEDILDKLTNDCCPGTTEWILKHQRMKAWLKDGRSSPILWLKGKPGCGKSTLCAKIVQFLQADKRSTLLYCFFNYRMSGAPHHPSGQILATLISQILRQNRNLSAYIYEDFVVEGRSPSVQTLKDILSNLLPQIKSPRIVVDGIDECIHYDASGSPKDLGIIRNVLHDVLQLEAMSNSTFGVKLLVSSRDILQIFDKLSRKPTVALEHETDQIRSAIRTFTHYRLSDVRTRFDSFSDVDGVLNSLENKIVLKSQEMFLWARLVLLQIEEDAFALNDLEAAIVDMPTTLNDFYARILSRTRPLNPSSRERVNTILKWMICSRRPLRAVELQDAIAFSGSSTRFDEKSKLRATVIDLCKPLIQVLKDNTVVFVHFTVQEFIVNSRFISLLDAERCVTNCCLNYMDFGFSLLDPLVNDEQRTINVGMCLYSLQSYTHEHWLDHLLASIPEASTSDALDHHLLTQLNRLLLSMKGFRMQPENASNDFEPVEQESILKLEPRLTSFKKYGPILELLQRMVQDRQLIRLQFGDTIASGTRVPGVASSPLSAVNDEYQKRVMLLLSSYTISGLDAIQLSTFKALFSPYAFTCRFPDCASDVIGFSTEEIRAEHEQTHAPPLLCTHSGCTYSLPFRSLNGLKRHIREYHTKTTARIPTSVRSASRLAKPHNASRVAPQRRSVSSKDAALQSKSSMIAPLMEWDFAWTSPGQQRQNSYSSVSSTRAELGLQPIEFLPAILREPAPNDANGESNFSPVTPTDYDLLGYPPSYYAKQRASTPDYSQSQTNQDIIPSNASSRWESHAMRARYSMADKLDVDEIDAVEYDFDAWMDLPISPRTKKGNIVPGSALTMQFGQSKPAPEPRKSNLLSLLNDTEPEEPRRKKRIEQNVWHLPPMKQLFKHEQNVWHLPPMKQLSKHDPSSIDQSRNHPARHVPARPVGHLEVPPVSLQPKATRFDD